jgi:tetratricopeptide (TPR) repeat protein
MSQDSQLAEDFRDSKELMQQGNYSEAEKTLQRFLKRQQELHQNDENTVAVQLWLGIVFFHLQKYAEAESLFRDMLHRLTARLGEAHPETLQIQYWLGRTLNRLEKFGDAEIHLQEALYGQWRWHGPIHENTILTLEELGLSVIETSQHDKAVYYFGKALNARLNIVSFGPTHPMTLTSHHMLGKALYFCGRFPEAQSALRQTIYGRQKMLGSTHGDTLWSKFWLACVLRALGGFDLAEALYREVLDGQTQTFGKEYHLTRRTQQSLSESLLYVGKFEEAEKLLHPLLEQRM